MESIRGIERNLLVAVTFVALISILFTCFGYFKLGLWVLLIGVVTLIGAFLWPVFGLLRRRPRAKQPLVTLRRPREYRRIS